MTDSISARAAALGLTLPATAPPAANYVPFVVTGNLVFISGQIPQLDGKRPYLGKVGGPASIEDGIKAAELCALNIIAWIAHAVEDDFDRVVRCVRLGGFVNSAPDFGEQPKVINGASDLIVKLFGEKGRHARAAVGSQGLPFDVSVEVDAIFEIR